ncbi:hypothetical protein C5F59_027460 [Streptomyces sp. QL37]|uniref:hypothetical protein n=1 Tax=Streptomyces sp. QL37 TaxID=2093747 RepID=UPI000CF29C3C|nr:hypothetical protein [Streptomyces sp. QL37]PPQ57147.1 hypothetical protein C5F59_10970 [Streptomyces sp. QL37]
MSLPITDITDRVVSHALGLGLFETVNRAEPKNAPGNGLTCAIWTERIGFVRSSGLASGSARLVFTVRIYSNINAAPDEAIDPEMLNAVDQLFAAYSADFTLGDLVRHVDLLGVYGVPLEAVAGYLLVEGGEYRVITIVLPLIVNDLWTEGETA